MSPHSPGTRPARTSATRGALAAVMLLLAACNSEGSLFENDRMQGQGGGTSNNNAILGEWETIIVISAADDLQKWTTNWLFRSGGSCRFQQTTESLVEGFPRVELRNCTWRTANGFLTVTYTDTGEVLSMRFEFAALDPNRLVLDSIEYHRVP